MELSLRLKNIVAMVDSCDCIADIGTDHGYIPIYLVKNHICRRAIASDINKGPVKKAKFNVELENVQDKVQCRLGPGLTTIMPGEVQGIVIAGMGGNLISNILEESEDVFRKAEFAILQPVQNPEVLREYVYKKGYKIVDEELCIDEGRFYEIIKITYGLNSENVNEVFYEIGKILVEKKHPLLEEYIKSKLNKYGKILNNINEDTEIANKRKLELKRNILRLEDLLDEFKSKRYS
ncbi:class I SAM-dependent methyltransferase [Clostridium sp. DJ247]|uniref:tRNA (adenine(22)-N(1))-methyltransferase n=1 Tax=Clostridium sp. DJ247 TaxID=2726188 RepID=UPI001623A82F|nr:class I SAM-dependent methyltransferase [Clostridium sp. DJ247]MBC2579226.1 SAM-dependent methyltransferase [Clostridium sp. DJ247]MBC2579323.1 SAM-dependent methyltransferase [Clostridium sp. DJ247]